MPLDGILFGEVGTWCSRHIRNSIKFRRTESNFLILLFLCMKLENVLNKKEANESKICISHQVLFFSNPLYADYTLTKALSVNAGDLGLTLRVILFYVQTRDSSIIWPWLYQPHLSIGQAITVFSNEAPNPNTGQSPKSGHQLLLLEGDSAPETIHMDPSWSFPWNSTCTKPAPSPRPSATCLIQERFITGLSTQSHLYGKR